MIAEGIYYLPLLFLEGDEVILIPRVMSLWFEFAFCLFVAVVISLL